VKSPPKSGDAPINGENSLNIMLIRSPVPKVQPMNSFKWRYFFPEIVFTQSDGLLFAANEFQINGGQTKNRPLFAASPFAPCLFLLNAIKGGK
jgi:hypothetical protein